MWWMILLGFFALVSTRAGDWNSCDRCVFSKHSVLSFLSLENGYSISQRLGICAGCALRKKASVISFAFWDV
jgi:hypothetical protein